jgi:hypothetical protein
MIKKIFISLFVIALFLPSGIGMAGPNMKEGLWEVTVTMDIPGVSMQMPPQKHTQCLTKDNMVPQRGPVEACQECEIIKTEIKGDTVSWVVECKEPEGTVRGNGEVTYRGDTFDGVMEIRQGNTVMKQKLSGRWIGKCNEK